MLRTLAMPIPDVIYKSDELKLILDRHAFGPIPTPFLGPVLFK